MRNEVGRGVFLSLTTDEDEHLWRFLEELQYEKTPGGLKEFLFDTLNGESRKPQVVIDETLLRHATASGLNFLKKKIGF